MIVLLYTAKRQRMQGLMGALVRTDLSSIILNLDRCRSRTSAASRTKFATTVSGWKSLPVVIKKSILVPKGVLGQPLLEIEMSKLNKHHSGREFY